MELYKDLENLNNLKKRIQYLPIVVVVLVGVLLFKLISVFENDNIKNLKIYYVSQKEIMDYEANRICLITDSNQKQLFFSHPEKAADLIEETAIKYEGKESRVIFGENKVYGRNVKSISKQVYEEVIDKLKEQGLDE